MFRNKKSNESAKVMKRFEDALSLSDTDPTLFDDLFGVPGSKRIDVRKEVFKPNELFPSQTTIQIDLAVDIAIAVLMRDENVGDLNSIISCNNYIMDGHHRWVGMTLAWGRSAKILGHQADLEAEDLIRVLNIITKSVLGRSKGNPGTGSIKDITPKNVRSVLQKFVRQGTRFGKFSKTPQEVQDALIKHFGSIEDGIEQISNNARYLHTDVPSWAPARKDMPVINEDEVSLTETLLEKGWITDINQFSRKGKNMNILQKLESRIARLEKVSAGRRRKEKGFSAKEHYESIMSKFRLPRLDRERYTPIPGLEGPFVFRGGHVLYYDPREGKYYNRDTDMYLSNDEADRITEYRNASRKDLKSVQTILRSQKEREANHFLHALSGAIVNGDILRSQSKKIKGELEINFSSSLHPSSPSYPEADTIDSTSGVRSKMLIEVDIKKLERSAKMSLSDLSIDKRSKKKKVLCKKLSKNIENNILRNMTDDQINIAFNYAMDEVENDLPMYYEVSDSEVIEYDYFVTDIIQKKNVLEITVETRIEYDVVVDFDQEQADEDYL